MKTIVWIHGDNLNPNQACFQKAPDMPALFVWDDALLEEWGITFKRVVFIYECLLELPVVIRRGNVAQEVGRFAEEHEATRVLTAFSPSPRHAEICRDILRYLPKGSQVEVVRDEPFVNYEGELDLKRFYRYWDAVKWRVMKGGK